VVALRAFGFADLINRKNRTLVELLVLNFLENDQRPERGLKPSSNLLRTANYHKVRVSLADGERYAHPHDPAAMDYCSLDARATLVNAELFIERMQRRSTTQWTARTLQWWNDELWLAIEICENGMVFDRNKLQAFGKRLLARIQRCQETARKLGYTLSGQGSQSSKQTLITTCITQTVGYADTRIAWTDGSELSVGKDNRILILDNSSLSSSAHKLVSLFHRHEHAAKQYTNYVLPMLTGRPDVDNYLLPAVKGQPARWNMSIVSALQVHHTRRIKRIERLFRMRRMPLTGAGSQNTKQALMKEAWTRIAAKPYSWPKTDKGKPVCSADAVRIALDAYAAAGLSTTAWPFRTLRHWHRHNISRQVLKTIVATDFTKPVTLSNPQDWLRHDGWIWPTVVLVPSPRSDTDSTTTGTKQLRIVILGPALQKFNRAIKACLVSRYGADGAIVWRDASGAEMRTAAMCSGDPYLIELLSDPNRNVHAETAAHVAGVNIQHYMREHGTCWCDVFKKKFSGLYKGGKHCNFGGLFLGQAPKLQAIIRKLARIELPLETVQALGRARDRNWAGFRAWQAKHIARVCREGFYQLPICGVRRSFGFGAAAELAYAPEIVNIPVQGLAALLVLCAQIDIQRSPRLPESVKVFANIYDDGGYDMRKADVAAFVTLSALAFKYPSILDELYELGFHRVPLESDHKVIYFPQVPQVPQ
jgi:hypothetical protein